MTDMESNPGKKLILTHRQLCDLELILNGGFTPLTGFLDEQDYHCVLNQYRLASGELWPIPVILDVPADTAAGLAPQDTLYLCNEEGHRLASMVITSLWEPDKLQEAEAIYATTDLQHPGVHYLLNQTHAVYVGGPVTRLQSIEYWDFPTLYQTPVQLRAYFKQHAIERVVGFQTRNPIHRAHYELTLRAARAVDGHLLIHPSVGQTKPGDIDKITRIRCYQHLLPYYPANLATLSLLPLAMRMAGPREALWHALIRKNYGCTHFIVGRDHAGPGNNQQGQAYYAPYAAQELITRFADEMPICMLPIEEIHYVKSKHCFLTHSEISADPTLSPADIATISGSELRQLLQTQQPIPPWFSYPEVIEVLHKAYPPREQQGLTLFFTGLPSSGKSTLANALTARLQVLTKRSVSLLDGDSFRYHFSRQLGFSKQDRDDNVKRVVWIAAEITKHQGIAVCALIAPYEDTRRWVRNQVMQFGEFIEIYVATPLSICEDRDPKGLYKKARANTIQHFTGVSDPYMPPVAPEITINTANRSVLECVDVIINELHSHGYLNLKKVEAPSTVSI